MLQELFATTKPVIGVIHLLPLPGSSRYDGNLEAVLARAEQEAASLASGGVHGIIIENFFDAPFVKNRIDTATACAMTLAAQKVKAISKLPLGINALRNDGHSAMAIATAAGAQFIRVNVFTGAMLTDQGIIEGEAHELMLYRRLLGADRQIKIFADVMVKHAVPLGIGTDIKQSAKDAVMRGGADALVISGIATGSAPDDKDLKAVREALPKVPIFIGSGSGKENAGSLLATADGLIVASSLKRQGILENPVDVERVRSLVSTVQEISKKG
ncbi:MAG: BtpA/SgcQ family protein [Candidatus Obscuribacterales bacterium]|nr:BtpA/SgcQ family protein [Candidatus Obscuribacterales bacterium]